MLDTSRIFIWGRIPLDNCDTYGLIKRLVLWASDKKRQRVVYYVNIYQLRLFEENEKFRNALNKADFVWPDGVSAIIASRLSGYKIKEKSVATDYYPALFREWVRSNRRVFFLGGGKITLTKAVNNIRRDFTKLKIVGYKHGYFRSSKAVIDEISASNPDILIVGMGSPKQEIWIEENKKSLKGIKLIWAVGGLFNYWSGDWMRAPNPIPKMGLEWAFRVLTEPRRMIPRYVQGSINLIKQSIIFRIKRHN